MGETLREQGSDSYTIVTSTTLGKLLRLTEK